MASFAVKIFSKALRLEETIQVSASMRIAEIRVKAAALFQDPSLEWLLYYHGVELKDSDTVQGVEIQPGEMILVNNRQTEDTSTRPNTSQPGDAVEVTLLIQTIFQTIALRVKDTDRVESVLARLDYLKADGDRIDLVLHGRTLNAAETIRELNLEDRELLQLVGKLKGGHQLALK